MSQRARLGNGARPAPQGECPLFIQPDICLASRGPARLAGFRKACATPASSRARTWRWSNHRRAPDFAHVLAQRVGVVTLA